MNPSKGTLLYGARLPALNAFLYAEKSHLDMLENRAEA
jgi:hypothetical protein